jgi:hypothetical protein
MIKLHIGTPASGMSLTCPPRGVNGEAPRVAPGADPGHVAGTRLSNLDLHGKLVKRGVTVSYHGWRYRVTRVNRGFCYGKAIKLSGQLDWPVGSKRLVCESVQVVA